MKTRTEPNPTETHETIKLGIDAHAKWYYVGRQVDGATPQPVQKMSYEGLLRFVAKQKRLAREVYTCYEAYEAIKGQTFYACGGIHRFREGAHGAAHEFVGMIAYVQKGTLMGWLRKVSGWCKSLWCEKLDTLTSPDPTVGLFHSEHERPTVGTPIVIHHAWVLL